MLAKVFFEIDRFPTVFFFFFFFFFFAFSVGHPGNEIISVASILASEKHIRSQLFTNSVKSGYSEHLFRPHTFKLANLKVPFWPFNKLLKVPDDELHWLSVPFLNYSVSPDDGGRSGWDDVSIFLALDLDRLFDLEAHLPEATGRPLPSDLLSVFWIQGRSQLWSHCSQVQHA